MSTNASGSPVLSLLIPIYNVQRYLRECLDSALAQTLKDIEIICINDGSTDNSPAIIREYMERDGRVKMIDKANSGYGDSMNHGLEMARGKYVGILESDDFMAPDALESLSRPPIAIMPTLRRRTLISTGLSPRSAVRCTRCLRQGIVANRCIPAIRRSSLSKTVDLVGRVPS